MPDWIEDAAKRLNQEKERQQANEDLRKAREKADTVNCPEALDKLAAAVEKDILLFNKHFPAPDQRLKEIERIGYTVFHVIRQHSPTYQLAVNCDGGLLKYRIEHEIGNQTVATDGYFRAVVDPDNNLQIFRNQETISYENASKELLGRAIEGLAWPKKS